MLVVQHGLERAGQVVTSLKLKTWRMGISVTSQERILQGFHSAWCVGALSVSALQLISAPTSAYGWEILFVPKCESATVGFTMHSLSLSRLLVSVIGKE